MSPKAARVIVSKFKQIMSLSRKKKKKSLSGFLSQLSLELRLLTTRLYVMCSVAISLIFIPYQVLLNLSVISTPVTVPPPMLQTNQLPSPSWDRLAGDICTSCSLWLQFSPPQGTHLAHLAASSFSGLWKKKQNRSAFFFSVNLAQPNGCYVSIWLCFCDPSPPTSIKDQEGRAFVLFTTVPSVPKTVSRTR